MLITAKRSEEDLAAFVATEWGFISTLCRHNGTLITPEAYQLAFWRNRARLRWIVKSRQVGMSFAMSLEALARCQLRVDGYCAVFVSFNLRDATEKIMVARQVFDELPRAFQKKLVTDTKTELAFESNRPGRPVSRIISVPSKAPRGRHGDLYLDELAHYASDRAVYSGSTALILRQPNAQLTGCSTPLGRRGVFWEIQTEEVRKYPEHTRQAIPWWLSTSFCHDVPRAAREAPAMRTEERVARFGRPSIREQLESLAVEDFGQELECRFVDESYSYLPYDLILPCTTDDLEVALDPLDVPVPTGRLVAGFDVGRTRDRSELAVFEQRGERFVCRLLRAFINVPFADQEGELRRVLELLPLARLSIDQSGIGMNLAENLARDYPQVSPESFTNEHKERLATDIKILFQHRDLVLPRDRDLVGQVHSIRRRVLPSGKVSFDAEQTSRGHADRFWAIALAVQRERAPAPRRQGEVTMRVIG